MDNRKDVLDIMMTSGSDAKYIADFECNAGGEGVVLLTVLDSYHQGVRIYLAPDGTWSAVPCGG